ncbi:hypothetical protein [Thermus thermophilus]|uniref:hypothetical protein n=1 Tax=Thermus thermophilus TaxID=274 RepID=UPI001FCC0348|nr:hypothetical protein [Thermus thermophilus]
MSPTSGLSATRARKAGSASRSRRAWRRGGDLLLLKPGPPGEASDQGLKPRVLQEGQEGEAEAHELAGGEVFP